MALTDPPSAPVSDVEAMHRQAVDNLAICMTAAYEVLDRHADRMNAWHTLTQAILVKASEMVEATAVDFLIALTAVAEVRLAQHRVDHSDYSALQPHVQLAADLLAQSVPALDVWQTLCARSIAEWKGEPAAVIVHELADDAAAAVILIAGHMRTVQARSRTKGFGFVEFVDDDTDHGGGSDPHP